MDYNYIHNRSLGTGLILGALLQWGGCIKDMDMVAVIFLLALGIYLYTKEHA